MTLPAGDHVPVTVTGLLNGRQFLGRDTINVSRGNVKHPTQRETVSPGANYPIAWDTPQGSNVDRVKIALSYDDGRSWQTLVENTANTGAWNWSVPDTIADSVRVAVLMVNEADLNKPKPAPEDDEVDGVVATSERFRIYGVTDVRTPPPATLAFSRPMPNPASGSALMRFGLPRTGDVTLELYDVEGRLVQTLASGRREAGWYDVKWSGQVRGGQAHAGTYWARLRYEGRQIQHRLVWIR